MADTHRLPPARAENWDWQRHAACRHLPEAVFFHPEHERGILRQRRENQAKAICAHCPVRPECRSHALAAREPYGVWGGLGEHERQVLLTQQRHERT